MTNLGARGEDMVARFYEKSGYKLVERNFRHPKGKQTGELDLVFTKGKFLVVVEVKTRRSEAFGSPFDSVDRFKQERLRRTTKLYVLTHQQYADYDCRIDVAAVDIDNPVQPVKILENAVEDLE
jgi:putative endonuclease